MVAQKKSSALSNYLEDKQQLTDELEVEHEKLSADSSCQATLHIGSRTKALVLYIHFGLICCELQTAKRDGE